MLGVSWLIGLESDLARCLEDSAIALFCCYSVSCCCVIHHSAATGVGPLFLPDLGVSALLLLKFMKFLQGSMVLEFETFGSRSWSIIIFWKHVTVIF
ncbi:hypothetical protein A2U01_0055918 [Trifolium medium]|uniref:Uncharacterized protein n=1 Tax=Trifolium medium TaxID=97028 RepID=A0A392RDK3_9FABA|nr:hypothetical protein [Trifolium medium]